MKEQHIIKILDETRIADLTESDLTAIRLHANDCGDCERAFEAAQVSADLFAARGAEVTEPSQFFHTKVMAVLRERQTLANPVAAFRRIWQSARAMVALMVIMVAALAVFTFVAQRTASDVDEQRASAIGEYSTENVIFNRIDSGSDELTTGQTLQAIYGLDEDSEK